jgi:HEAT repeat protein
VPIAVLLLLFAGPGYDKVDFGGSVQDRVRLLKHRNPGVRRKAALLLEHAEPDRAIAAMLVALGDSDALVREAAALTLAAWKDERATPFLAAGIKLETNARTLRATLLALGACGGRYAARHVTPFLEHPSRQARAAAAAALGTIGDAGQRGALWAAFRHAPEDPDFAVRSSILGAFVRLGWKEDARKAIGELEAAGALNQWRARVAIVAAIGALRWKERASWLVERIATEEDTRVISTAVAALAELGQIDAVAAYLVDPRPPVQQAAMIALQERNDRRGVDAARQLVRDAPDVSVRFTAAMVLYRAKEPEAKVHLVDALRSNDPFIWITALSALEKRYGKSFGRNPAAWTEFLKKRSVQDDR